MPSLPPPALSSMGSRPSNGCSRRSYNTLALEDGNSLQGLDREVNVALRNLGVRAGGRNEDQPELVIAIVENPHCDRTTVRRVAKLESVILAELEGVDPGCGVKSERHLVEQCAVHSNCALSSHDGRGLGWRCSVDRLIKRIVRVGYLVSKNV